MRTIPIALWIVLSSHLAIAAETAKSSLSPQDLSCAQTTSRSVQVMLTNAGLIDTNKVDEKATHVELLAKERLPHDATRQVFLLTLHETQHGRSVTVIATSKTAEGECPYDQPKAYVVAKSL